MNILFEIKYKIYDNKRNEYLDLIKQIKDYYKKDGVDRYMVFEDEKNKGEFTELFLFASESDFEKFEENSDEDINQLLAKLASELVVDKKIRYKTKLEV